MALDKALEAAKQHRAATAARVEAAKRAEKKKAERANMTHEQAAAEKDRMAKFSAAFTGMGRTAAAEAAAAVSSPEEQAGAAARATAIESSNLNPWAGGKSQKGSRLHAYLDFVQKDFTAKCKRKDPLTNTAAFST